MRCLDPLPDGGPCHSCRLFDALLTAEAACATAPDVIDQGRCLQALQVVLARFMMDMENQEAVQFLVDTFRLSRTFQAEDNAPGPLTHTEGTA
jgi:hypothetical protein